MSEVKEEIEIGKTYGMFIIIREVERAKNRSRQWLCKCNKCNKEILRRRQIVLSLKHCLCSRNNGEKTKINLLGQRRGNLVVIEDMGPSKSGNTLWKIRCDSCGNTHIKDSYTFRTQVYTTCKKCFDRNPEKLRATAIHATYHDYKKDARYSGEKFNMDESWFSEAVTTQRCFSCGRPPYREYKQANGYILIRHGIDKIKEIGYDNGVTSKVYCWDCNECQSDRPRQEWFDHCRNVALTQLASFDTESIKRFHLLSGQILIDRQEI